jgi:GNAT superfamily N-acetyltransferase
MKITLRKDPDPQTEFYYHQQFKIYHEPYLIWDRETWEAVLSNCAVYRIDVNGTNAGDVILEGKGQGVFTIVDFGLLPEFQGKGVGRAVLNEIMRMSWKLTAVTREETLPFFLKCGFALRRRIRDYYERGVEGFDVVWADRDGSEDRERSTRSQVTPRSNAKGKKI